MKILIIEDERSNADRLCRMLDAMQEVETQVLGVVRSNSEAREWFAEGLHLPDLILADIQLGDGLSFEALKDAPAGIPVIFTTAYDQYAINAFSYNGIAYLLKPFDQEELTEAFQRVKQQGTDAETDVTSHFSDTQHLQTILNALRDGGVRYRERFLISFRDEMKVINANEVSHIGLVEGTTYLYTLCGKQYCLTQTLEELESQLNPERFMRVTRQYIVNVDAVDSLVAHFLGKMKLRLRYYKDTDIIISRAKVPIVKKWLDW